MAGDSQADRRGLSFGRSAVVRDVQPRKRARADAGISEASDKKPQPMPQEAVVTQVGPVEVLVVSFPGSKFNGSVAPALRDVVARGDIAVVDLAFMTKDPDGTVAIVEMSDVDESSFLDEAFQDVLDLLNEDDLLALAESLDPGSSAVAMVFEHTWARQLAAAVRGSEGEVIFSERIPRDVVEAAVAVAKEALSA